MTQEWESIYQIQDWAYTVEYLQKLYAFQAQVLLISIKAPVPSI